MVLMRRSTPYCAFIDAYLALRLTQLSALPLTRHLALDLTLRLGG